METRETFGLIARYLVLVVLGIFSLKLFYAVFSPLTIYPVFWVIKLFEGGALLIGGNLISFSEFYARIIPACIAGAAYYLLLILNLSTPMDVKTRIKSIIFLVFVFLIVNIIRILVFAGLLTSGYAYFDLTHKFVWYFGSTLLVVLLWFVNVWLFKIKDIPIYSDLKNLFGDIVQNRQNVI